MLQVPLIKQYHFVGSRKHVIPRDKSGINLNAMKAKMEISGGSSQCGYSSVGVNQQME